MRTLIVVFGIFTTLCVLVLVHARLQSMSRPTRRVILDSILHVTVGGPFIGLFWVGLPLLVLRIWTDVPSSHTAWVLFWIGFSTAVLYIALNRIIDCVYIWPQLVAKATEELAEEHERREERERELCVQREQKIFENYQNRSSWPSSDHFVDDGAPIDGMTGGPMDSSGGSYDCSCDGDSMSPSCD